MWTVICKTCLNEAQISVKMTAGALQIINAAYLSAWNGCRVKLPADGDIYTNALRRAELAEGAGKGK